MTFFIKKQNLDPKLAITKTTKEKNSNKKSKVKKNLTNKFWQILFAFAILI